MNSSSSYKNFMICTRHFPHFCLPYSPYVRYYKNSVQIKKLKFIFRKCREQIKPPLKIVILCSIIIADNGTPCVFVPVRGLLVFGHHNCVWHSVCR